MLDLFTSTIVSFYNYKIVAQYLDEFVRGVTNTITAALAGLVLSLVFGFVLALVRMSRQRLLAWPSAAYVHSIRATPLLLQIYIIYFGLPVLMPFTAEWSELTLGVIALTLHTTPYMAEIIRSGIESVPKGQREGAIAVGMTPVQQYRYVILPQALTNTIPALLGQTAILVKDTSLISLISVFDLVSAGMLLNSERILPNEGFLTVAAVYLLIYVLMLQLAALAERHLAGRAWNNRQA